MDDDASYRNQHPGSQLQQSLAQRANLGASTSGTGSPQAQLLQQNIRGRGEQDTKLVGPEAGATGAADFEVVQLLDTILYVTALAVDPFINPLFCCRKHCLDNMFVTEEAFVVFKYMNNAG